MSIDKYLSSLYNKGSMVQKGVTKNMINYSQEVEKMCCVAKGPHHGPAPIPEEGKWVKAYDIKDISGFSHGVGWCAPQQGTCKLTLNVKTALLKKLWSKPSAAPA